MRLHAYILVADPTWLATSVGSYLPLVDKLVVSYDESHSGWTGSPIPVERCLEVLRSLPDRTKLEWAPGSFRSRPGENLVGADTRQRRDAFERAASGADWVIQIDTDEVMPRWEALEVLLAEADRIGCEAVEWPMRILYRRLRRSRYLEIVTAARTTHHEYPGPIAVRPNLRPVECRRVDAPFLRPTVVGDEFSLQIARPPAEGEHRVAMVSPSDAIWHNSWARAPAATRTKIASWSHNQGLRSWLYYYTRWLPAPATWRGLRNLHPLHPPLWPRLGVVDGLPFSLAEIDEGR